MGQSSTGQPPADIEFSADQSSRVARRLAHGVYRLTHGEREIGEEVWGIFALLNGTYRLLTDIDLAWPVTNTQHVQLDLDARWKIQGLWVHVDLNHSRRVASYIPEDDGLSIEIVESRVRERDEEQRSNRARLRNPAGVITTVPARPTVNVAGAKPVLQRELPFQATSFLDYASTMFNFVILQRLQLLQGASATFNTVVVTLPSLEPLNIQQTYHYEGDEALGDDEAKPLARRYTITETGSPDTVTTFWTDARGIVVRQQLPLDGELHVCEMVNYRWLT